MSIHLESVIPEQTLYTDENKNTIYGMVKYNIILDKNREIKTIKKISLALMCDPIDYNNPDTYDSITVKHHSVTLTNIYIFDEYTNKGYGYKAMLLLLDELEKMNIRRLILNTSSTNISANKLYLKCGFKIYLSIDRSIFYEIYIKNYIENLLSYMPSIVYSDGTPVKYYIFQ